jgi:hypothetical protein
MLKKVNWALTILVVWLFLFLAGAAHDHLEPRFCSAAMLEAISKQQDVLIFNCFEFWLNRYQSLIGTFVTALLAGATLWWVARQFTATNRQAAVAAAQAMRGRIAELDAEDEFYTQMISFAGNIKNAGDWHKWMGVDLSEADVLHKQFSDFHTQIWQKSFKTREFMESDPFGERVMNYIDTMEALEQMAEKVRAVRRTLEPKDRSGGPLIIGEEDARFIDVSEAAVRVTEAATATSAKIAAARLSTWEGIRRFENAAIAPD